MTKIEDIIRTTTDNRTVKFLEYKGQGTLSERYTVEIDGKPSFLKMYAISDACAGSASRNMVRNEILVYQKLNEVKSKYQSLYREAVEIDDVVCLLFDDFVSGGREGKSFADIIFDKGYTLPPTKEEVKASNILPLNRIVHIIASIAQQAEEIHSQGIIHRDVSPDNFILVNEFRAGNMTELTILSDFGLATGKGLESKYLYNQTTTAGISGTYYGSVNGILHNRIYSPPNIDKDYEIAKPSYDTYNLANILCLALTGRLIEYWKKPLGRLIEYQKNQPEEELQKLTPDLGPQLKEAITQRKLDQEYPLAIDPLIEIILVGTDNAESNRYQTAAELHDRLLALQLPPPSTEITAAVLPCTLPLYIEQFTPSLPPLESLCNQEISKAWQELHRCADQSSSLLYSQQNRKHIFGRSIGKDLKHLRDHPPFGIPKVLMEPLDSSRVGLIATGFLAGSAASYLILELLERYLLR